MDCPHCKKDYRAMIRVEKKEKQLWRPWYPLEDISVWIDYEHSFHFERYK